MSTFRRAVPRTVTVPGDPIVIGMAVLTILGAIAAASLAADRAMYAVALASALLLVTVIIIRPDAATLVTLAILYSNAAVIAVRFHGVPLYIGAAVPLLLVIPVARDLVVRRLPVVAPPLLGWMIALLLIHVVSAMFSADLVRSWDAVVIYAVEGMGLTFLLINVIRTPMMLRQATWVLIGAGAFVSLMSVHQDLTNNYDNNYWGFAQVSNAAFATGEATLTGDLVQPRLAGSIGETNRFAQVMLMLIPLGIYRYIGEPSRVLRLAAAVATTMITLGVVLTFSRGAAVGLGALLLALAVLRMVRWHHLAAILLSLSVVFAAFPHYWDRVTSITQLSALVNPDSSRSEVGGAILSRATEGLAAVLIMADHPVIGIGPAMYPVNYEAYAKVIGIRVKEGQTRESHNLYLGLGAEIGIVGLGIFLIIAFLALRMIVAARQRSMDRRSDLERLVTPFGLSLMTYYVTGMFLHLSFARFYWLILAVGVAAALIVLREMRTEEGRTDQGAYSQSV